MLVVHEHNIVLTINAIQKQTDEAMHFITTGETQLPLAAHLGEGKL